MTDMYNDQQGSRKKFLVPLVVLLLCGVAMTGAAFAYSTSVNGGGDVPGDYYSIDVYSDAKGETVITQNLTPNEHFIVYTEKTVGAGAKYTAKVEAGTLKYTFYTKVATDIENQKFTLTATAEYKAGSSTAELTTGTVTINAYAVDDAECTTPITSLDGNTVYKVVIVVPIEEGTFGSFGDVAALNTAVNNFDGKINYTLNAAKA